MDFSDLFKCTSGRSTWSPDGHYLANAVSHRLLIRDATSLKILHMFTCQDVISNIIWSMDSSKILATMLKRGLTQVWSISEPDWTCTIDEGPAGLAAARWTPDSLHIIATSEFQLRATVWSLVDKTTSFIRNPKFATRAMEFSPSGRYLALCERADGKDYVSVVDTGTWRLVKRFNVATLDLDDLRWSPDNSAICVWGDLLEYTVLLYSPDGRQLASYSAYSDALGIKTISWAPSSQFLAIGSFDGYARLLNRFTWKPVAECDHPSAVSGPPVMFRNTVVYSEAETTGASSAMSSLSGRPTVIAQSRYDIAHFPLELFTLPRPDPEKPWPRLGVGLVSFSFDSHFFATRCDQLPRTVWIWDVTTLSLSVIIDHRNDVRDIRWHPIQSRLAIVTGNQTLYFWRPDGCSCVEIPTADCNFRASKLHWNQDGDALAVYDKERFCVCFPPACEPQQDD